MKPRDRRTWIEEYLRASRLPGVDVLTREFVEDYIVATGAKFQPMAWGAHRCLQLGNDLRAMKRLGKLERHRVGLAGNWQPGFPTWVWSYKLSDNWNLEMNEILGLNN